VLARFVLLRLSTSPLAEACVRRFPLSSRLVARFVAGETMEEAAEAVRELNRGGMTATLDHLGENVTTADEARRSADHCRQLIAFIAAEQLDANVSVKLTQLGLDIATDLATEHMRGVLAAASAVSQFVRIDMESSLHVDRTIQVFRALWPSFKNVGLVFQSYLYRSREDVETAIGDGVRVRLVKGAYDEPASVAFRRKSDVDAEFGRLTERLLRSGVYPAIATHDERLIEAAKRFADREGISRDGFEFQMLYGIRRDLQRVLVRDGYRVRIYTPFGTQWYGYMMRRLAERPANMWFVLKNMARR